MERRYERMALALAGLRILVGVIWLANLSWKLPPDFGKGDAEGLLYSFRLGEQYAVVGFLRDFMSSVAIPHFTLFGWLVFLVELTAGILLLLGFQTHIGAILGTVQAIAITLLVVRAPEEWFWGYVMFIALNVVPLIAPAADRLSVDHWRARRAVAC